MKTFLLQELNHINKVVLCVPVRGSEHGGGADRRQRVDSCQVSVVSERRPESLRPRSLSGSQKAAGQLERRRHARPAHQVHLRAQIYWNCVTGGFEVF